MALSERSRSELYQVLSSFVSEEALGEMMSYFPARDVEEPVTKEFFRAESTLLRADVNAQMAMTRGDMTTEMSNVRSGLTTQMSELRKDLETQLGELRKDVETQISTLRTDLTTQMGDVRGEIAELRGQMGGIRVALWANAGLLVSFAGLMTAMIKL